MVVFTCSDEECGRVFHQEPAYIKHMLKHLNDGGEYLKNLKTKRKRRAKTPKPEAVPIEKKKKEQKRIESAREEREKRQKRRRDEAEAISNNATPSTGKNNRGKRRRKVWQTIASGRVGDGNSQGDVIDLRSPSRSPSIELATPQANKRGSFTLTPDTVPSTSRDPTPEDAISDMAVSSLHHLTGSLASGSKTNSLQSPTSLSNRISEAAARQVSEEAVVAHHHSTSSDVIPHASRETSEEAIIIHHHDSVSRSSNSQVARSVSEEAIISYHHNSPTPQATRGTSEEAVIIHHHDSPLPHASPQPSEEAVTAFHHMSLSMSPIPSTSREMSEEAVIAHHHSNSTLPISQVVPGDRYGSTASDNAITENDHASASILPSSLTSIPNGRQTISSEFADSVTPSKMETAKTKTFDSNSLSMLKRVSSLLRPFAYPVSTPLPSPPLNPKETRSITGDPFSKIPTQGDDDVSMNADVENISEYPSSDQSFILSTPPRNASTSVPALHSPITPSRLGPTWKTETAPQSVIGDEDVDELESESESGEDEDEVETPRLEQFRLDPKHWHGRSLFQKEPEPQKEHDVDTDNSDSNAWAMEYGIDPEQWDDTLIKTPPQVEHADFGIDDPDPSEFDEGYGTAKVGSSYEDDDGDTEGEDDEDDVDGECGYRVFAGWADLGSVHSAQCDDRHQTTTSPGSCIIPFGFLTPRRPTAFEATMGHLYERPFSGNRPISASPGSSTGRVSAELDSPPIPLSHTGGRSVTSGSSPSYLFNSRSHHENMSATTPYNE